MAFLNKQQSIVNQINLKFIQILLLSLICSFSAIANARASLMLSNDFRVLAMNGKDFSKTKSNTTELSLRTGVNRIVMVYQTAFQNKITGTTETVRSIPFLFSFYAKPSNQYRQQIVKPANYESAILYANKPRFNIINISKSTEPRQKNIEFSLLPLVSESPDYLIEQSRVRTNRSINLSSSNSHSKQLSPVNTPKTSQNDSQTSKMLRYWWERASEKEREAFLKDIRDEQSK